MLKRRFLLTSVAEVTVKKQAFEAEGKHCIQPENLIYSMEV